MPDDDWALGQNEVDVRNEPRRDVYACRDPEGDWIRDQQTTICTNDEDCQADEHQDSCPVEQQLRDKLGF